MPKRCLSSVLRVGQTPNGRSSDSRWAVLSPGKGCEPPRPSINNDGKLSAPAAPGKAEARSGAGPGPQMAPDPTSAAPGGAGHYRDAHTPPVPPSRSDWLRLAGAAPPLDGAVSLSATSPRPRGEGKGAERGGREGREGESGLGAHLEGVHVHRIGERVGVEARHVGGAGRAPPLRSALPPSAVSPPLPGPPARLRGTPRDLRVRRRCVTSLRRGRGRGVP